MNLIIIVLAIFCAILTYVVGVDKGFIGTGCTGYDEQNDCQDYSPSNSEFEDEYYHCRIDIANEAQEYLHGLSGDELIEKINKVVKKLEKNYKSGKLTVEDIKEMKLDIGFMNRLVIKPKNCGVIHIHLNDKRFTNDNDYESETVYFVDNENDTETTDDESCEWTKLYNECCNDMIEQLMIPDLNTNDDYLNIRDMVEGFLDEDELTNLYYDIYQDDPVRYDINFGDLYNTNKKEVMFLMKEHSGKMIPESLFQYRDICKLPLNDDCGILQLNYDEYYINYSGVKIYLADKNKDVLDLLATSPFISIIALQSLIEKHIQMIADENKIDLSDLEYISEHKVLKLVEEYDSGLCDTYSHFELVYEEYNVDDTEED